MVKAVGMHFEYEDGMPYYPFGTTVYALAHQPDPLVEETLCTLKDNPFNKVRMCVFPKNYNYNKNEPPFYPFEKKQNGDWDVGRPCISFWKRFEHILQRLWELEIQVDLILFHPYDRWGFCRMTQADNLLYLNYLQCRLAAWPGLWWSLANEYDLNLSSRTMKEWEELEEAVASSDPWKHLLSVHNCFQPWDYSRPNITHISLQTKVITLLMPYRQLYQKPVILDECCYEGNLEEFWGSISGKEMTARFWMAFASGAWCTHGETYLDPTTEDPDNAVVWWSKGGKLIGESPKQIAFLRKITEEVGVGLEPIPDMLESIPPEKAEEMIASATPRFGGFLRGVFRMEKTYRERFLASEHKWRAHAGNRVFIVFYDRRTCASDTLDLPETETYRIEQIDIWKMERKTVLTGVKGKTRVILPGTEGTALIAWKE